VRLAASARKIALARFRQSIEEQVYSFQAIGGQQKAISGQLSAVSKPVWLKAES
jgi:hypothetical protein